MKKFGIIVVKPDAVNKRDFSIIKSTLKKYDLNEYMCFKMNNYIEIMTNYREADILFKDAENAQQEIKGCGVALKAYKELFPNSYGYVLLLPVKDENPQDFFEKMNTAKREARSLIENSRGYYYAYVDYKTNPKLVKLPQDEYRRLKNLDKSNINRAYINGVHVEDYECFTNNFCLGFMIANKILRKDNLIENNLNDQKTKEEEL